MRLQEEITEALPTAPVESAKVVGLRYITDDMPGWRRQRSGRAFRYLDADGKVVRDRAHLSRIKALAIPPAWKEVWICPLPDGHLQATGRDARGRKQHRYHPRWREVRDETKYARMLAFARAMPGIRKRVEEDLKLPGLPRNKVLATVIKLLELSLIRVGNEEYAKENNSFGLTTLRNRHVEVDGSKLHFGFRGKGGKEHEIEVQNPRLARIVKICQDLPGQELFQYLDAEGRRQKVNSDDVNDYLREISGSDFTAKDFRTWSGTVLAARALQELERCTERSNRPPNPLLSAPKGDRPVGRSIPKKSAKKNVLRAIERVAERLGNTPAVCRKCYVHPAVVDTYLAGTLRDMARRAKESRHSPERLPPEEAAILRVLERRMTAEAKQKDLSAMLAASLKARRRLKKAQ